MTNSNNLNTTIQIPTIQIPTTQIPTTQIPTTQIPITQILDNPNFVISIFLTQIQNVYMMII